MSKRLRASLRASNRGRVLRPKATRPRSTELEEAEGLPEIVPGDEGGMVAGSDAMTSEPPSAPEETPAAAAEATPAAAMEAAPTAEATAAPEPVRVEPVRVEVAPVEVAPVEARVGAPVELAESAPAAASAVAEAAPSVDEPAADPQGERRSEDAEEHPDAAAFSGGSIRYSDDSVPPFVEAEDEDDVPLVEALSPEALARRARLRRVVGAIVGFAAVISVVAVGKSMARPTYAPVAPPPVAAAAPPEPKAAPETRPASDVKPAPEAEAEATPAPAPAPAPAKDAEASKAEPAPADKPAADPADAAKLRKEALSFLNRGRYKDAIESARAAIAADPGDAMAYLYLGSALQDSGKWKDGIAAYSDCVRNAKKGPVHECAAMGGRK